MKGENISHKEKYLIFEKRIFDFSDIRAHYLFMTKKFGPGFRHPCILSSDKQHDIVTGTPGTPGNIDYCSLKG